MKKGNIIAVVPSNVNPDESYYKRWTKLLNNRSLIKVLKERNITIYFYSKDKITFKSDRVIRKRFKNLKKADLLITDDLRVNKKFIRNLKPVIYYRFDKLNGLNRKYTFGRVISDEEDIINKIIGYSNMNYKLENYYQKKINSYLIAN